MRTVVTACLVILASAFFYGSSGLIRAEGVVRSISFPEALYFSTVTFATVGYGDFLPLGWVRTVAVFEGLAGISLMPIFLIALTRRYLRICR